MIRFPCFVAVLALTTSAAFTSAAKVCPVTQGQENRTMEGLRIGTFPRLRAVLPGESTLVETTFENRGTAAIELPSSEGPSPLAFELLSEKDRTVRYRVSQATRDARRSSDIAPDRVFPAQALEPGHSVERHEDLADLAGEDFAPGKYLIRTLYPEDGTPQVVSALSPMTVLAPRIESFSSSGFGVQGKLVTAYAHRRDDGGVLLLEREAFTTPNEGVAFRRIQLGPGPAVQVAVAIDAVEAGNGRWFAWIRDGIFEAAVGWGNRVVTRLQPLPIGGASAVLLSPGFQIDIGVAVFGIVLDTGGKTRLKVVRTTGAGASLLFDADLAPQAVRNVRWNYQPDRGFDVFWQDAEGRVFSKAFDSAGKTLVEARPVSALAHLAWSVDPLGEAKPSGLVHTPEGRYLFRTFSSQQGGAWNETSVPVAAPPEHVSTGASFAFCHTLQGTKITLADAGKVRTISLGPNTSSEWQEVADAARPLFLHSFTPRGRSCWVEWFEAGTGVRRIKLP